MWGKTIRKENAIDTNILLFFASHIYVCKYVFFGVVSIKGKKKKNQSYYRHRVKIEYLFMSPLDLGKIKTINVRNHWWHDSKLCQQLWPEIAPQITVPRVRGSKKRNHQNLVSKFAKKSKKNCLCKNTPSTYTAIKSSVSSERTVLTERE